MPLNNYTTTVAADKTANEIVSLLGRKGATAIMLDYDGLGNITGIKWRVDSQHGPLSFSLPVEVDGTYGVLTAERVHVTDAQRRYRQARRTAWRNVKEWTEAQMALLETTGKPLEEVFLPYMLTGRDETLYQRLRDSGFRALPAPEHLDGDR